MNLAELLALQGEFERAVAIAEEAYEMTPIESDHITGIYIGTSLSKILALSGERDRALELLTKIIDRPSVTTRWELYLDPRWDFFRDDERFNDLIRPHNLEQSSNE
jgi:tetratricopeptide (TPR) repeat protein